MSGSRRLGPAVCLSVAGSTRWSVQPTDEKVCEKQHQHRQWWAVFVDVWSFTSFHTFCWTDKRMNICVPSFRRSPCKYSSKSLASGFDSESVSATIISLMASSSSFIFSRRLHYTRTTVCGLDMSVFYSESKTDLKLRCNWVWNSKFSRVLKRFLGDWRQCVSCYYPTIPTDYPSTLRGRSVGPPVAVGIYDFSALLLSELYGYSMPLTTFLVKKEFRFIGQCWYFNPQWTPEGAIIKARSVTTVLVSWEKCAVTKCYREYQCLWRG